jgi:beta-phosphoglucomutase-like phosphatase (HAD superfamily)
MRTLIFDFDGVIHSYTSPWVDAVTIPDPPIEGIKEAIEKIRDEFIVVVVSTRCFSPGGIEAIKEWLAKYEIEVDDVTDKKPPAFLSIDDRAICFDGNAESLIWKINSFKHWTRK